MSQTTDATQADRYASLFVSLTDRESVTQSQHERQTRRLEAASERDVAEYVAESSRESGLGDAIAEPEDA